MTRMTRSYSTLGGVVHTLSDGRKVWAFHNVNIPGAPIQVQVETAPGHDWYGTPHGHFYTPEDADAHIDGLEQAK